MSKLENWFGKLLYTLIASQPVEDYICEDANGVAKIVPVSEIYAQVVNNSKQRS